MTKHASSSLEQWQILVEFLCFVVLPPANKLWAELRASTQVDERRDKDDDGVPVRCNERLSIARNLFVGVFGVER